jgi:hypothetical protein
VGKVCGRRKSAVKDVFMEVTAGFSISGRRLIFMLLAAKL